MNIKETITEEYIQFHYKKEGNHHFIKIRYNDEVEYRRVEIDGVNNIQVSKEERQEWLKKRDEVLGKMVKARKLYSQVCGLESLLHYAVRKFRDGLDLEDSLDKRLFNLADSINIEYADLEEEAHRIPYHVLKKYEEKMDSDGHLKD